jgi:hypothetical protein
VESSAPPESSPNTWLMSADELQRNAAKYESNLPKSDSTAYAEHQVDDGPNALALEARVRSSLSKVASGSQVDAAKTGFRSDTTSDALGIVDAAVLLSFGGTDALRVNETQLHVPLAVEEITKSSPDDSVSYADDGTAIVQVLHAAPTTYQVVAVSPSGHLVNLVLSSTRGPQADRESSYQPMLSIEALENVAAGLASDSLPRTEAK